MEPNSENLVQGRAIAQLIIFGWLMLNMLLVAVWDGWCMYRGRWDETITDVFIAWNRQVPLMAVAVGFTICHIIGLGAGKITGR